MNGGPSQLLKSLGIFTSLTDIVDENSLKTDRVSGIGIKTSKIDTSLYHKLNRMCTTKGKVFMCENTPVTFLLELKDKILFLVSQSNAVSVDDVASVGVYYFEVTRPSIRFKRAFKSWHPYFGRVCHGKTCLDVNWLVYVPTYCKTSFLFLSHPKDLVREDGNEVMNVVKKLTSSYLFTASRRNYKNVFEALTIPLFL